MVTVTWPISYFGGLCMVHHPMWVGTVRTCEKVCLWSRHPFWPLTGRQSWSHLDCLWVVFGPCGFMCVAVAGGPRLPGHKMVTTYVSQELNSPLRCHVTTELKPLAVLFQWCYCTPVLAQFLKAEVSRLLSLDRLVSKIDNVMHFQGSHSDWKTWKNGKAFSSQGKVREFLTDWKSQGKPHKILENWDKLR